MSAGNLIRAGRQFGASLFLALIALLVFLIPGASSALQLDRAGGNSWQWLSCHFTHWNFDHLVWDLVVLAILGAYCEKISKGRFLATLGLSAMVVPLVFLRWEPELQFYRGLSGIGSAVFALTLVEIFALRNVGRCVALAAGLGFLGKVIVEIVTGQAIFVSAADAGFTVLPSAHLAGFLCGVGVGLLSYNFPLASREEWRKRWDYPRFARLCGFGFARK
ncbi:rhombosortase [Verrucomicrobiales bacterium]|nr:rhombosortase [Verrucomicrobiales bacterium]